MGWKETKERFYGFRRVAIDWLGRYWMWVAGGVTLILSLGLLYPAYLDYQVVVEEKDRIEALRNLALAGAAMIGGSWGFVLAIWRARSQQQAADAASFQAASGEQKQISESFANAIELLGSASLAQRLGAIHTLGRLAYQNRDLHVPIMELLTSFIREHAPWPLKEGETSPDKPRADIQEAVKVLGRRNLALDPVDFNIDLRECNLEGVEIIKLNLTKADLWGTNLGRSFIDGSDFSKTRGHYVRMQHSVIFRSNFRSSILEASSFTNADISGVDFRCSIIGADFTSARINSDFGANDVRVADLSFWEGLGSIPADAIVYDDKTIWPEGFTPPAPDAPVS